jgi:hypothetical protein
MKNRLMSLKALQSPIIIIIIAVLYLITILGKVSSSNIELSNSNQLLEDRIKQQELKKKRLGLELYYYETDSFLEKEAKNNLNLKKENEKVVIIPDRLSVNNKSNGQIEIIDSSNKRSNITGWIHFLFGTQ